VWPVVALPKPENVILFPLRMFLPTGKISRFNGTAASTDASTCTTPQQAYRPLSGASKYPAGARPSKCIIIISISIGKRSGCVRLRKRLRSQRSRRRLELRQHVHAGDAWTGREIEERRAAKILRDSAIGLERSCRRTRAKFSGAHHTGLSKADGSF
jgi:hypothetical protein